MRMPSFAFTFVVAVSVTLVPFAEARAQEAPASAEELAAQLASDDAKVRATAAAELSKLGPDAEPALDALIGALGDSETRVRIHAMHALLRIGAPAVEDGVPALTKLLDDDDVAVRRVAAGSVLRLRTLVEDEVAVYTDLLGHARVEVRLVGAKALYNVGPARAADVVELLGSRLRVEDDDAVRDAIGRALRRVGSGGEKPVVAARTALVGSLVADLGDEDAGKRLAAARGLGAIPGWVDGSALEALSKAAHADDVELAAAAVRALPGIGEEAVPLLVTLVGADDASVRAAALIGLLVVGKGTPEAAEAVLGALEDPESAVQLAALRALRRVAADPDDAGARVGKLIGTSDDIEVRLTAISVVASLGDGAAAAVPALVEALTTAGDARLRSTAARTLGALGATGREAALPALLAVLADASAPTNVRAASASALGTIDAGGKTKEVARALAACFGGKDRALRKAAAEALGALGSAAVDFLLPALEHEAPEVRLAAASSLQKIGSDAAAAASALEKLLFADGDTKIRRAAAVALVTVSAEPPVDAALRALESDDAGVRGAGCFLAGLVARGAPDKLVGPLGEALADASSEVRIQAAAALARVGADAAPAIGALEAAVEAEQDPKVKAILVKVHERLKPKKN